MRFNKQILIAFCLILNLRILTELPRAISLIGWSDIPEYDFNRILSLILILFCSSALLIKRWIVVPRLIRRNGALLLVFFLSSVALAVNTFNDIGMPLSGIFVVVSRFVIEILLIVFVTNFVIEPDDVKLLFNYFFKTALGLIFLICFLQLATSSYSSSELTKRMQGPFGSPGTLGSFMHLFIALTLYYYSKKATLWFWIVLAAEYVILFFSGSVANIIANLLLVMLVSQNQKWYKSKRFYLVFPVIFVLAIFAFIYNRETVVGRVSVLADLQTLELPRGSSIAWRFDAFGSYLSLLGDSVMHWLFGLGVGTQRNILHPDYPNSLSYIFDAPGTHNDYLAVLIDFGLIGLGIFIFGLVIVYGIIKRAEANDMQLYYLKYYFYTILFVILSENYIDQLVMFILIVFLTAIVNVKRQQEKELPGSQSS